VQPGAPPPPCPQHHGEEGSTPVVGRRCRGCRGYSGEGLAMEGSAVELSVAREEERVMKTTIPCFL
jgi:hypothetical protein